MTQLMIYKIFENLFPTLAASNPVFKSNGTKSILLTFSDGTVLVFSCYGTKRWRLETYPMGA